MSYSCSGSEADTKDVAACLKNKYGYSSANWKSNYSVDKVISEMRAGRPVILRGGKNTGWWIFGVYSDGHAWVCDGYMSTTEGTCNRMQWDWDGDPSTEDYEVNGWREVILLRMNWGWGKDYNGYYYTNNFNPGVNTFNYKVGMVTDIKP